MSCGKMILALDPSAKGMQSSSSLPLFRRKSRRFPCMLLLRVVRACSNSSGDLNSCENQKHRINFGGVRLEEIVDPKAGKLRLDSWISSRISGISRVRVQSSIKSGLVAVNGRIVDKECESSSNRRYQPSSQGKVFNVSYNNLSGRTPDKVAQFATFDESSYRGNPFLCGWPLLKSCNPPKTTSSGNEESNNSFIDMGAFYVTFGVAYGTVLTVIVAVLCINPYWRRVWFYYIQMTIDNSYYFIIDNVPFLSRFKFPKFYRRIYRYVRD
ncbi:receptor-like protein 15 isoform X2 [Euphorbia lathyris]|uniref:receptor-like protein 15 isoform X2 n=1 Tax=Euphorbia lathyris TaxID=212925 RepID=UPI003314407F